MTASPARHRSRVALAALFATCGLVGCGTSAPPTSTGRLFASAESTATGASPVPQRSRVDDDADPKTADVMPAVQPPPLDRTGTPLNPPPATPGTSAADAAPAAQVAAAATPPTADPATPAGGGGRAYMIVGGVVAKVNETPVYAHTVFAHLDRELAAQARTRDRDDYREYAYLAIRKELKELVANEQLYIGALRELTEEERHVADAVSIQERDRQVKQAGGSVQEAVRRAAADGYDFDERMEDYHREMVIEVFEERHLWPLVSISAADMLDFYHANLAKLYTRRPTARYRVIKLDPRMLLGSSDPVEVARLKAEQVRLKAARGDDFAALASAENHDPFLKNHGGDPNASTDPAKPAAAVGPGTYAVDAVDQAVWALNPGQVTAVIPADGSFYVAKLEEKTPGEVKAFDAPGVQEGIYRQLIRQQKDASRQRYEATSREYIIAYTFDDAAPMLMDMAMQKYAVWTRQ